MVQEYCATFDIFLLECSSQKREEKHRHADGGEEQHGYTHEGEGCNGICNCFFHNAIIFKCISIDVYNFVAATVKFHRCYNKERLAAECNSSYPSIFTNLYFLYDVVFESVRSS